MKTNVTRQSFIAFLEENGFEMGSIYHQGQKTRVQSWTNVDDVSTLIKKSVPDGNAHTLSDSFAFAPDGNPVVSDEDIERLSKLMDKTTDVVEAYCHLAGLKKHLCRAASLGDKKEDDESLGAILKRIMLDFSSIEEVEKSLSVLNKDMDTFMSDLINVTKTNKSYINAGQSIKSHTYDVLDLRDRLNKLAKSVANENPTEDKIDEVTINFVLLETFLYLIFLGNTNYEAYVQAVMNNTEVDFKDDKEVFNYG